MMSLVFTDVVAAKWGLFLDQVIVFDAIGAPVAVNANHELHVAGLPPSEFKQSCRTHLIQNTTDVMSDI